MNPAVKGVLFTLVLVSLAAVTTQSPLDDQSTSTEYLITRQDVHDALSKIIDTDDSIALLSDFDGTLAVIDPNPVLTAIKPEAKEALEQLVTRPSFFVGIISGRPMLNVRNKVGIENVTYSGNHGMEILFTNKTEFHYPITADMYKNCTMLKNIISTEYGQDKYGGWVEDKNISLVYHYAFVPEHLREQIITEITAIVKEYGYNPVPAHSAIEIKPPVVWSKGHAARLILADIYGNNWHKNNRVIYMGDDTSDEDVMKMLKGRATTFRITENPDLKSHATYKMQSVDTAVYVLEWLVNNTILE